MTLRGRPRLAAGVSGLVVFAVMFAVLNSQIAPLTYSGFLPQSAYRGYPADTLGQFAQALHQTATGGLYRNMLRLDLLFMALWGYWVVAAFPQRRKLGGALACIVLAVDLTENILLEQALGWAMGRITPTDWALYPPLFDQLDVARVTQIKLVLYPLVTVPLLIRDFTRWRS